MKTTVDIPEDLAERAQELASKSNKPLKKLIVDGLRKIVSTNSKAIVRKKKLRRTSGSAAAAAWLAEWKDLSDKVSARVGSSVSAAEIVSKMRR